MHSTECEFEVEVRDNAVTCSRCTGSDKPLTYDPNDRDDPFRPLRRHVVLAGAVEIADARAGIEASPRAQSSRASERYELVFCVFPEEK